MFETFRPSVEAVADRQAAAAFGRALMKSHDRAHERARAALSSSRFRLLLLDAAHWIEGELEPTLGEGADDPRAAEFAVTALARRRRALRRRLEALDWDDPFARHKARISAKKMRYASEFFLDMGPGSRSDRYRPFVKALSALQDDLGRLNDFTVAEPMLPTILQAAPSEAVEAERVGYAAGLIMGRDLAQAAKLSKSAKRASRAFLDKPIWW
jgi:CHAD domain-containing protein